MASWHRLRPIAPLLFGVLLAITLSSPSLTGWAAPPRVAAPETAPTESALGSLAWVTGDWETAPGESYSEEHWTRAAGNLMLGMSRTLKSGKTISFEFMRIEARPDGVFYVAQPKGRPGVDFKLGHAADQEVVFDNPGHDDHLTHIRYRKNADGSMTARIEGANGGQPFFEEYAYQAMPKP